MSSLGESLSARRGVHGLGVEGDPACLPRREGVKSPGNIPSLQAVGDHVVDQACFYRAIGSLQIPVGDQQKRNVWSRLLDGPLETRHVRRIGADDEVGPQLLEHITQAAGPGGLHGRSPSHQEAGKVGREIFSFDQYDYRLALHDLSSL